MTIRYLVKFELAALFLSLLILSTFLQFKLPFVSFVPPQLTNTDLFIEWSWLYAGTYSGNLQLPMVFLMLAVLEGLLTSVVLGVYLLLGLSFLPIFFYGGGWAYLQQPTFGYLLILLPAAWLWMYTLKRHPRRYIPISRYVWTSMMALGLIHLFGGLYAALYYKLIPFEFLMTFVLPRLTWEAPSIIFIVLLVVQIKALMLQPARRHAA